MSAASLPPPASPSAWPAPKLGPVGVRFGAAQPAPLHVGFVLLRQYSMIAFANAIEPFRMANYVSCQTLYTWSVVIPYDGGTAGSNGLTVAATARDEDLDGCGLVFVCGGADVRSATDARTRGLLRRCAARGIPLAAVCSGSFALASAGLLDGYRSAIHWEKLAVMREEFPRVHFSQEVFVIDRDRYTCSGGTAPLDLSLHLISARHGARLSAALAEQFVVDRQRAATDRQRMPQPERVGPGYDQLAEAIDIMAANIEETIPLADIAAATRLSLRQLERLFDRYVDTGPAQYYMTLRLRRARELLTHGGAPIMQITLACGFQSASHFSKAYRKAFGHPPSVERRRPALRPSGPEMGGTA